MSKLVHCQPPQHAKPTGWRTMVQGWHWETYVTDDGEVYERGTRGHMQTRWFHLVDEDDELDDGTPEERTPSIEAQRTGGGAITHDPAPATATLSKVACGWTREAGTRIIVELLHDKTAAYIRATRYLPAPAGRLIVEQKTDTFAGPEIRHAPAMFRLACQLILADHAEARR